MNCAYRNCDKFDGFLAPWPMTIAITYPEKKTIETEFWICLEHLYSVAFHGRSWNLNVLTPESCGIKVDLWK